MTAQPLSNELLDELTGFDQSSLLSEFKQRKYLLECDKAIRTDAAEGYMCKAIVYSLSNNFDKMSENFQIALRLAPGDKLIRGNFIISLANYGRFNEVKEQLDAYEDIVDGSQLHAFSRLAVSILDLETLHIINNEYALQIENAIQEVNLNINDVFKYLHLFNNLMQLKKVRFGVVPSISWVVRDGEIFIYYDFVGSAIEAVSIMDEFNQLVASKCLKRVARKLSLILLPLGNS